MITELPLDLEKILEAGNNAPSGENSQPWRFFVRGSAIEIHLIPERDQSAYNWGQRASYLACGAAVENMLVAASAQHRPAAPLFFPNASDPWHVATIFLAKDTPVTPDPLASFIQKRVSNRKAYRTDPLTAAESETLTAAGGDTFVLVETPEDIRRLGRVGATNEEVMLANRSLHQFFFSHVSWTKKEDEEKKTGFYIKTLELPPPARVLFKLFSRWSRMRFFNTFGFNRIVAKQNGQTNARAAAMGAFCIPHTEPLDLVSVGRRIERLWLVATSLGLWLQPLTGILFFKLRIVAGEGSMFSARERELITNAYGQASRIIGAGETHLAFMFRIGRGNAPSAHAIRFPLTDVVTLIS